MIIFQGESFEKETLRLIAFVLSSCGPPLTLFFIVTSDSARRDIEHALEELQRLYPMIITSERAEKVVSEFVDPLLEKHVTPTINNVTTERMEVVLFPPGEIFHLYRNSGAGGISGSVVPCQFFNKIDVRRNMVEDHLFFSGYERIFLDVMRLHYQDHSFQFDNPVTPNDDADSS